MTAPPQPSPRTIWRRRAMLMAVVGILVAIPVTLLVRGGDDDEDAAGESAPGELNPRVSDADLRADYRVPEGWRLEEKEEVLTLRSASRGVQVGLTAPAPADRSEQVLDDALASIKASYETVDVGTGAGKRVGGLPAEGAVVRARGDNVDLRILVAVMKGRERTYLLEIFTAAGARPKDVADAQRFLNTLKLRG